MEGGGGSSNNISSSTCLMGFGDGVGLSNLMIMPPSLASSSKHHHHDSTTLFPFSCNTNASTNTNTPLLVAFNDEENLKAKIMTHPHYPRLLSAYVACNKIGAPPEVVAKLEEACNVGRSSTSMMGIGEDPALDQFMEAYCEMLTKYEEELSKPFKEAMMFFSRVESQFKSLALSSPSPLPLSGRGDPSDVKNMSSDEDAVEADENYIDPQAEDRELKGQLLRKYSGYIGSLKKEFLKKRKKGKLPKEARQQLLDWWSRHYKWPYPSESQKLALAESTGLDQKQINNWFINQRKRHWKPSEEVQYMVMDSGHPAHYYLDSAFGAPNPFSVDCGPTLF